LSGWHGNETTIPSQRFIDAPESEKQLSDSISRAPRDHDEEAERQGCGPSRRGPVDTYTIRPYPSAGASYELELYLAVNICEGLARGFYHYDAGAHALAPICVPGNEFEVLLAEAQYAMGVPALPQVLITIAARFGRVSWKYSSIAYALILKDAGVLTQTLYLAATDMGLGGCAIGIANIDLFAKMTGTEFHVEGPVGQFAIGRGAKSGAPD
jgi:SagB-type dehydrogenase family enzyme